MNETVPNTYEGKVIEIKSNYIIVKTKNQKVLVYTKNDYMYHDYLLFDGMYTKIKSVESKTAFNFQKYSNHNNIYYSIKPTSIKTISEGKSIKSKLYNSINDHPTSSYLKKIFFSINSYELTSDLSALLSSSGILLKSLLIMIRNILKKCMYEKKAFIFELLLLVVLMISFKYYELYLYVIISRLLSKSNFERLDQLSLSTLILLFIFPNYLFSISFMISFLYKLLNFIQVDKNRFMINFILFIPIQLLLFYKCNLLELLLFPYYRLINILGFLLAIIDVIFKSSLSFNFTSRFLITFKGFEITGHMNFFTLFFWIVVSLYLLQNIKLYKVLLLGFILFINQNQLWFNPSLIYTQLYIGQGDAAILKYPHKKEVMIIDTGSAFNQSLLEAHLNYYGIKTISHLVISHADEDHSGNKDYLINNFKVINLIEDPQTYDFYKLNVTSVNYGSDNENDSSLITFFSINDNHYLSLGDVSSDIEKQFLNDYNIEWNIVKLSHHGSNTGSSKELLEQSSIKLLLNSSGVNNMYNHPHQDVLKRIYDYNHIMLDTQRFGDIEIKHLYGFDFLLY